MTTDDELYASKLPDGVLLITADDVRAEMRRIEELRRAGDHHTARSVRENLMVNALIAVYVDNPDAKAIAASIVGPT